MSYYIISSTIFSICSQSICKISASRKAELDESMTYFKFMQDCDDQQAWIIEKIRVVKSTDIGKNLQGVTALLQKHTVLSLW